MLLRPYRFIALLLLTLAGCGSDDRDDNSSPVTGNPIDINIPSTDDDKRKVVVYNWKTSEWLELFALQD
ncbi:hypothetical protein MNBD_GAMMA16-783 [hydrothermal vent metagenome]|uniref:Uncharacterized protein n=1 Tax=hydrothermal vent metagenome TaxID=652676 RepID=A0A3B0ZD60_9ZZZZ